MLMHLTSDPPDLLPPPVLASDAAPVLQAPPLVFILSSVRSGSTLLKAMLDSHSRIFAPAELHLLPFDHLGDAQRQLNGTVLGRGLHEAAARLVGEEQAQQIVESFYANNTPVAQIYQWLQAQLDGRILVDKSPSYLGNPRILQRAETVCDTQPLYIFLTRHPFDVFDSFMSNGFDRLMRRLRLNYERIRKQAQPGSSDWVIPYHPSPDNRCKTSFEIAEATYVNANRTALEFLKTIPAERQVTVTYENLVHAPEAELEKICRLLKIDFESAMLSPYKGTLPQETVVDPKFYLHQNVSTQRAMKWQERADDWLSHTYAADTVDLAAQMGYDLSHAPSRIPLTPAQAVFFKANGAVAHFCLVMTTTRRDSAGLVEQMRARLPALLQAFPGLRHCFVQHEGRWTQKCLPVRSFEVPLLHETFEAGTAGEQAFAERVGALAQSISLEQAPLFRVLVGQFAEHEYRVAYVFHHLLLDGKALLAFHEALWSMAVLPAQSVMAYTAAMQQLRKNYPLAPAQAALAALIAPCAPLPVHERSEQGVITRQIAYAGGKGYRFHECTLALEHAYRAVYPGDSAVVAHRIHRRRFDSEHDYTGLVAWLAGDVPLACTAEVSVSRHSRRMKREMKDWTALSLAYDWLYLDNQLPALPERVRLRLNYFPVPEGDMHETRVDLHQSGGLRGDYLIDFIVRDHQTHAEIIVRFLQPAVAQAQVHELLEHWAVALEGMH